jgi:hypothetical protein
MCFILVCTAFFSMELEYVLQNFTTVDVGVHAKVTNDKHSHMCVRVIQCA